MGFKLIEIGLMAGNAAIAAATRRFLASEYPCSDDRRETQQVKPVEHSRPASDQKIHAAMIVAFETIGHVNYKCGLGKRHDEQGRARQHDDPTPPALARTRSFHKTSTIPVRIAPAAW